MKKLMTMIDKAEVEMDVTPEMEKLLIEIFNVEIEVMQGSIEKLPDGKNRIKFEVGGEKAELIKEFILKGISKSHKANLN